MCLKKGLPWLTSSKVMFITFLATLRQHWPISEKNLNRGKGLRIWNFQGYQRNSMWSFQGLIKNEVGQFIWSNTILWNIQGLSFFLSRVCRGKVKKWKIPRRDGGSKKYILNKGAVWIFSGIGHFRQIMQSYSSCITDRQIVNMILKRETSWIQLQINIEASFLCLSLQCLMILGS